MSDRLAGLLNRYTLNARFFFSGALCQDATFDTAQNVGHLHLIRSGSMCVRSPEHPELKIDQPSLLFYPRPTKHHLQVDQNIGVELVCASVEFGAMTGNPLAQSLPSVLLIPLVELPALSPTLELLFDEAMNERCGRQAAIDRLFELLLIQLLRYSMEGQLANTGLLSGLSDKRLCKAITAMHDDPRESWSIDTLARVSGMSRARFAVHFRETVGITPGEYLAQWRLGLAQALLKKGKPVGLVADEVGYGSATSLSRAFKAHIGLTPSEWHRKTIET